MDYIELRLLFSPQDNLSGILTAQLMEAGFEGFEETAEGLLSYIPSDKFDVTAIKQLAIFKNKGSDIHIDWRTVEEENWNELWEASYDPVIFPGKCAIRAPFHQKTNGVRFDIIIEPKMSFGTAHHATTAMMITLLFEFPPKDLTVVDMGCGTGILAILASRFGAREVTAIDNDIWAYENTLSNIEKNNAPPITVYHGDATCLTNRHFDMVLANINRNILVNDIPAYAESLNSKGLMLISGFYEKDLRAIRDLSEQHSLNFVKSIADGEWLAAVFIKNF
ncbi:MAG: 50S ribosomal protein L11 methyltransferase [Bacteroidetes bacterium]|nr:50S ribosomal protein L11 methyltransferase [Bacteroidota bacterium]